MNVRRKMILTVLAVASLMATSVSAQMPKDMKDMKDKAAKPAKAASKAMTLVGKVEGVNATSSKVTVNHGKVEGWMDAMTMAYEVDKPESLKNVKTGDQIKATVYEGDMKLHNVQVVPPAKAKQK